MLRYFCMRRKENIVFVLLLMLLDAGNTFFMNV